MFDFRGGTNVPHHKLTAGKPIERLPLPAKLIVHLRQHIGAPAEPVVKKGDTVLKGQLIAEAKPFVSAPVHAPTSGKVKAIAEHPHPSLGKGMAIVIEPDGEETWAPGLPDERAWEDMETEEILARIKAGGLVGLGGASFPTHVKLTLPPNTSCHTVLLNGAECEPYLTSDDAAMRERPGCVVTGLQICMRALGAEKAAIGVEDNKPEAIAALRKEVARIPGCEVVPLPSRYPQGAERSLIKTLMGTWLPAGKLPLSLGVVVQNVSTAIAIVDAVTHGLPLIERLVTVTGPAVAEPKNVRAPLGAPWEDLLRFCGGTTQDLARLVMGGPMMGSAQNSVEIPLVKGTSGILALRKQDIEKPDPGPCVRCGKCVEVCPMGLAPLEFPTFNRERAWFVAKENRVLECVECGSCEYCCPSNRPIVASARVIKSEIRKAQVKKTEPTE